MSGVVRHIAATLALGSILACSGLGLCWRQFVRSPHDCCAKESPTAPVKSCASPAEWRTAAVKIVPPSSVPVPAVMAEWMPTSTPVHGASFAPSFPVKSPPLVLRL
jgi:hypothetical protein